MSWSQLNNLELAAMRRALFLDVSEAAEHIGKVAARSWQRWEDGTRSVPPDVDEEVYRLIQVRSEMTDYLVEQQVKHGAKSMPYFKTFEEYQSAEILFPAYHDGEDGRYEMTLKKEGQGSVPEWRLYQSSVAFVFAELGDIEII